MTVVYLIADVVQRNTVLSTVFLFFLLALVAVQYHRSPWRRLPPGPRGLPFLGNLHQLVHGKQWVTFSRWKETHGGPVFYLNAGGQPIIVLGSLKAAADLLDRRASIYSDRPRSIVASEIMTGGMVMSLARYNDSWKRMRKACHEELSKSVVSRYQNVQLREAVVLAEQLLTNEQDCISHVKRMAVSSIMSLLYGVPIHTSEDAEVARINDYVENVLTAALPGAHLVESFPWMKYIPPRFASWKRRALEQFEKGSVMFQELFDGALERKANGDDRPTLASRLMEDAARNQLSVEECSWLAGAMYGAAAEALAVAMEWWLLAMLIYPDTQMRAQEEIDRVVGRDRLPTFADMKNMPYIQGMVREVLRWGFVSPLGVPHSLMEDDWYNGYFLPKNSIVIANVWGINHDPALFGDDACHFNPERHLDEKGQIAPGPADTKAQGHVSYGFGRRICVGRHVANNGLFMDIATLLWAANIERTRDENGQLVKLDPDAVVEHGLAIHPQPFDCKITPRSPDVLTMLHEAKEPQDQMMM